MNRAENPLLAHAEQRRSREKKTSTGSMSKWLTVGVVLLFTPLFILGLLIIVVVSVRAAKGLGGEKSAYSGKAGRARWTVPVRKTDEEDYVVCPNCHTDIEAQLIREEDYGDYVWMTEAEQLEQLNTLLDAGILSKEEYRQRKARIRDYDHH